MNITKKLSIQYAKKLLPHFNLEKYPAIFKDSETPGFEKELIFVVNEKILYKARHFKAETLRFLFGPELSILQKIDSGFELDITEDVNAYLKSIYILDAIEAKQQSKLNN